MVGMPPEGASLEEVWAWMSTLPSSDTDATFNINMYMAYNQVNTDSRSFLDVSKVRKNLISESLFTLQIFSNLDPTEGMLCLTSL